MSSLEASELAAGLGLHLVKDRAWQIQACSARTGEGLAEGLEWLLRVISDKVAAAAAKAGGPPGGGLPAAALPPAAKAAAGSGGP